MLALAVAQLPFMQRPCPLVEALSYIFDHYSLVLLLYHSPRCLVDFVLVSWC